MVNAYRDYIDHLDFLIRDHIQVLDFIDCDTHSAPCPIYCNDNNGNCENIYTPELVNLTKKYAQKWYRKTRDKYLSHSGNKQNCKFYTKPNCPEYCYIHGDDETCQVYSEKEKRMTPSSIIKEEINKYTGDRLRAELRGREAPVSGNKEKLKERLIDLI